MLKDFVKYLRESKEYRKEQIIALVFSIAVYAVSAIMPFVIRSIIKDIEAGVFSKSTLVYFILLFAVLLLTRGMSFLSRTLNSRMTSVIGHEKRYKVLGRILEAKIHRRKKLDDSAIIDRLMREIYCYSTLLGTFPITVIDNLIKIVIATAVLVYINIYLFFISILLIPLAMFLVNLTKEKMKKAMQNQMSRWEGTTKITKEILASVSDIKQMNSGHKVMARFGEQNQKHFASETHINKISILTMEIQAALASSLPMFCLLSGLALVLLHRCDIGSAIAFYMYVNYLISPFSALSGLKVSYIQSKEQEKRIQEIIDTLEFESSGADTDFGFSNITVKKAAYQYGNGKSVLFEKRLDLNKPGLYYINAVSGFGKTTVFKLMTKLLCSDDTDILFDNRNVNSIPESVFFHKVSYLNGTPLFIHGTVIDTITSFGRYDFDEKYLKLFFDDAENVSAARELNIGVGESLSSGQLQRINILRLFAKGGEQKLIVLDEAISGVEEEKEREILDLLKTAFSGSIIILVTHRKSSEALCDYKIELRN